VQCGSWLPLCAQRHCLAWVLRVTASAQQNGLVNVAIGDVNILNNADIGVAAQLAANICGVKVVAVLGTAVDRSGDARTVCTTDQGPIRITQA
jgi:hypothetical protein